MTKTAPHAFSVDDIALTLVSVPNPVPSAGHFNRALLGTFSRAPKKGPNQVDKRIVSTEGKGLGRTRSGDSQQEDREGTTDDVSKA